MCALFHVGRRSSIGRPASLRGLRPLQQPPASLLRPPRGSIGSADCTVASSFLPSIFRVLLLLLAALCKSSAMLVRFVWPLFCPRSTQSGRPASCLSCLHSHTFTLTLSLTGVGWKKRIALCSSQAAGLSLSLCPASPSRRLTHSSRGIVVGKFDLQLLFLTFSPPPPSSLTPSLSSAARLSEGVFLKANSSKCPAGFLSDILAGRAAHFVRRLGKFSS